MTEEAKQRMIESVLKNARVGQLNIVMESGVTVNYYESSSEDHHVKVSDEQISRAINAINGKDKVLKHQQKHLLLIKKYVQNVELKTLETSALIVEKRLNGLKLRSMKILTIGLIK